jgi:hypothetical protein
MEAGARGDSTGAQWVIDPHRPSIVRSGIWLSRRIKSDLSPKTLLRARRLGSTHSLLTSLASPALPFARAPISNTPRASEPDTL